MRILGNLPRALDDLAASKFYPVALLSSRNTPFAIRASDATDRWQASFYSEAITSSRAVVIRAAARYHPQTSRQIKSFVSPP
jgi:hypothetical protein